MGQPVVHWEIAGKDGKALLEYYATLFDWKVDSNNQWNYGMVETGGEGGINGGIMQSPHGTPFVTLYVQVDDVQAYLDKATGLGGTVVMSPTDMEGVGKIACFTDPDGNVVGLFNPVANGSAS
jgi:predicted enzyme related to lactoylglutathione lyase